jgi:outer membrane protein OmpU
MNKLKTIGLSALAGSLAAFSAQAFEASVSGGAEITISHAGSSDVTGNPLGARKNITFSGSGELDNGWGISVFHALGDTHAYSSSVYSFDMGSMGTISLDSGSGGHGAAAIDNIVPTAYEEADYGFATGAPDIGGTASGEYIGYSNTIGAVTVLAAWNPDRGGGTQGDGGFAEGSGSAWDFAVKFAPTDGMLIAAGVGRLEHGSAGTSDVDEDTLAVTYATGPVTVGAQISDEDPGQTEQRGAENTAYSVSFNINDNLSVSYGHVESDESGAGLPTAEADSIQAAYTMGGATVRIAEVDVENAAYSTAATADSDATVISLGLAF